MHTLLATLFTLRSFAVGPQLPLVWRGGRGLTLGRDDSTFSDPIAFTRSTPAWNGGGGGAGSGAGNAGQGEAGGAAGAPPASLPGGGATTTTAAAGAGGGPDLAALQASLDAAKRDGQTEAQKAMLAALGFDKLEDAQAWVTAQRDKENASLSEMERREREVAAKIATAEQQTRDANAEKMRAKIVTQLVIAGAPAENVQDLVDLVKVSEDADDDAIKTEVEAKKAKFPALFATPPPPAGGGRPPGTPAPASLPAGGGKPEGGGDAQPLDAGRNRAQQVKEQRTAATAGSFPFPGATS